MFKRLWPKFLRPEALSKRAATTIGGTGNEQPDFKFLTQKDSKNEISDPDILPYICVMPASAWGGKCWPVSYYFKLLCDLPVLPVILGTKKDKASFRLVELLKKNGVEHVSDVDRWDIAQVAQVLAGSHGLLGNDTGLGHLADAIGVPTWIIYGPTTHDLGFGSLKPDNLALGSNLWCRPCGKDGRYCFRYKKRFYCMNLLKVDEVRLQILNKLGHKIKARDTNPNKVRSPLL